ncbi:MAG: sulfurtransferase TusA family protein [Methylococcales bacterium]|nr:sulfurtransferase TusA family protein [Methylococcales bacterium]
MSHHELNARNLLCPMPVIKTQNSVKTLAPGDILTVWATDPGVMADIPAWCRINGHVLISAEHIAGECKIVLEVGA